jgi:uncharacterized protein (TIGR02147 family)
LSTPKVSIFAYSNYREYLAAFVAACQDAGESLRAVARRCDIASPNYLQQVVSGQRNLTQHFARKVAVGASLNATQGEYLLALVDLEAATDDRLRQSALDTMRRLIRRAERRSVRDEGLHASWVNQVVWEAAKTKRFSPEPAALRALLRGTPSLEDVTEALKYLRSRGYLEGTPAPVDFQPSNDVRRVDLQRSHLRFLQLAQHRLNDPLSEREYQGLTAAIRRSDFEAIRRRCREFVAELNRDFAVDEGGDDVMRVQLGVFKLTILR